MAAVPVALKTELTELPESRVRLQVEIPPEEVERRLQRKARDLAGSLRLPGFRRGKVPPPLVIQRIGREAVLEQAVSDTLSRWYADAVQSSGIVPVGDPTVDLGELPPAGGALSFSVEIGVLPRASLGTYKGLQVPRREPKVDEQAIDAEIDALRERLARLETAERPAAAGDFVVVDHEGELSGEAESPPGEAVSRAAREALGGRDRLIELGGGRTLPQIEEALIGAAAGDERTVQLSFPEDHAESALAGASATMRIVVKEVKRKELPAVDDDLAMDAGFEGIDELRDEIRGRLEEAERRRVEGEFREAALDVAVAEAQVEVPQALIRARAGEMWERMLHSLQHRGISRETYLQIDGRDEEQVLSELEPDAQRALRREAVITAVVEAEGIEPGEQELEQALTSVAHEREAEPAELVRELRRSGRIEELRDDLAAQAAIDLIAESAEPIEPELAQAREQLWTPEKGASEAAEAAEGAAEQAGGGGGRLWTP